MPTDHPAIRPNIDLQNLAILGAGERLEGLAAAGTPLLFGRQVTLLDDRGKVRVVSAGGPWPTGLLPPSLLGDGGGVGGGDGFG
jgi:hypothetical protein